MRVTQNSSISTFLVNINNIKARTAEQQVRIATGKVIQNPSDSSRIIAEVKRLKNNISQNDIFAKNIQNGLTDTQILESTLQGFSSTLLAARDITLEAANPLNHGKASVLGENIRQLTNDLLNIANHEFNGRFAFSGTLTTRESIEPTPPQTTSLPYELVEDESFVSESNPSGLRVFFKGNSKERRIQTSVNTTEQVNALPDKAFGANGTAVFDTLIDVYNELAFNSDGSKRGNQEFLTVENVQNISDALRRIGDSLDTVNSEIGRLGAVTNRMINLTNQLEFENSRLRDLLSLREDADIVEASLKLRNEENALQFSFEVGSRLIQQSLLDFLR